MPTAPSDAQRRAIEAPPGPVLVVAGPGAGKTFCLIRRIEYLITELQVPPRGICTVTFTNKAAEEIATRLATTIGEASRDITGGTLHALCVTILRRHGGLVDLPAGFGIADEEYQDMLLRRLGVPRRHVRAVLGIIRRRKLKDQELPPSDERLFVEYNALLRRKEVIDFDDIILYAREVLAGHPDIANSVADQWSHLLVDEFQDISRPQFDILARLAPHHRIFVVGDDEQSIFSWAGADPEVLRRFRDVHRIDEIVLDENRRCSTQIFETARKLLTINPTLFDKEIRATRRGEHDVTAYHFFDEDDEWEWIARDIQADRTAEGGRWGDYAILYRQHHVGEALEKRFVAAGMPCRLARGRSLTDDPVIAYAIDSLKIMMAPGDPIPVHTFAERVLPRDLLQHARTGPADDLLGSLRAFARGQGRGDPEARLAWRFIYHVENLHALWSSHDTLPGLLEELLSRRTGKYQSRLQERADELSDPLDYPGAAELAERIAAAVANGGGLWLEPAAGREFAHRALCEAAGLSPVDVRTPASPVRTIDVVLSADTQREPAFPVLLFKALQILQSRGFKNILQDYVAFDLETTDRNTDSCEIVEIGAVRVRDGKIGETFRSLVRATRPVSAAARSVHGYGDSDLRHADPFPSVWERFRTFVGTDVLVAHNAQQFDVPVLRRMAAGLHGIDDFVFYDTLPVARSLFRTSVKLESLAERFNINAGRAHHALDDVITLAHVVRELNRVRLQHARTAAFANGLDYLGLALALTPGVPGFDGEAAVLFDIARVSTVGRYSDCLDEYEAATPGLPDDAPTIEVVIDRLGGASFLERIRRQKRASDRHPNAMARLQTLVEACTADTLAEQTRELLERVALSTSTEIDLAPHHINLLTLHATKGLEFSRVYIVGVEDYQIPGYYAKIDNRTEDIQEGRRLLYVGMTRARDRLVLTRTDRRRGKESGGSMFLEEMGITPEDRRR